VFVNCRAQANSSCAKTNEQINAVLGQTFDGPGNRVTDGVWRIRLNDLSLVAMRPFQSNYYDHFLFILAPNYITSVDRNPIPTLPSENTLTAASFFLALTSE